LTIASSRTSRPPMDTRTVRRTVGTTTTP
jgi:hypothetical protein